MEPDKVIFVVILFGIFVHYFIKINAKKMTVITEINLLLPEKYPLPAVIFCYESYLKNSSSVVEKPKRFREPDISFSKNDGKSIKFLFKPFQIPNRECAKIVFNETLFCHPFKITNLKNNLIYIQPHFTKPNLIKASVLINLKFMIATPDIFIRTYVIKRSRSIITRPLPTEFCNQYECKREVFLAENIAFAISLNTVTIFFANPITEIVTKPAITIDIYLIYVIYLFGTCFGLNYLAFQKTLLRSWMTRIWSITTRKRVNILLLIILAGSFVLTQTVRIVQEYLLYDTIQQIEFSIYYDFPPLTFSLCKHFDIKKDIFYVTNDTLINLYDLRNKAPKVSDLHYVPKNFANVYFADFSVKNFFFYSDRFCFILEKSKLLKMYWNLFTFDDERKALPKIFRGCYLIDRKGKVPRMDKNCLISYGDPFLNVMRENRLPSPYITNCFQYEKIGLDSRQHCIEKCVFDRFRLKHPDQVPFCVTLILSKDFLESYGNDSIIECDRQEQERLFAQCQQKCHMSDCEIIHYPQSKTGNIHLGQILPNTFMYGTIVHKEKLSLIELFTHVLGIINFWFGLSILSFVFKMKTFRPAFFHKKMIHRTASFVIHFACLITLVQIVNDYLNQGLVTEMRLQPIKQVQIPDFIFCSKRKLNLSGKVFGIYFLNQTGNYEMYDFSYYDPRFTFTHYPKYKNQICIKLKVDLTYDMQKSIFKNSLSFLRIIHNSRFSKDVSLVLKNKYLDLAKTKFVFCKKLFHWKVINNVERSCRNYNISQFDDFYYEMQKEYLKKTGMIASALPFFDLYPQNSIDYRPEQMDQLLYLYKVLRSKFTKPDCNFEFFSEIMNVAVCAKLIDFKVNDLEMIVTIKQHTDFSEFALVSFGIMGIWLNWSMIEFVQIVISFILFVKRFLSNHHLHSTFTTEVVFIHTKKNQF